MKHQLLAGGVAAAFLAVAASPAHAACTSTALQIGDVATDSQSGLAPEIVSLDAAVDAGCGLRTDAVVGNRQYGMLSGDFVSWFLDTDNSTATGSPTGYRGADWAIGRMPGSAALLRWDGTQFSVAKSLPVNSTFGAAATLADVGAVNGTPIAVAGGASWRSSSTGNSYFDFAPEPGQLARPLPVTFAAAQPAPVQQQPAPVQQQPAPTEQVPVRKVPVTTTASATDTCIVPNVRGLTIAQAKRRITKAGCVPGRVTRATTRTTAFVNRVLRTTPRRSTALARGARVSIVVGRRPARARAASASDLAQIVVLANAMNR